MNDVNVAPLFHGPSIRSRRIGSVGYSVIGRVTRLSSWKTPGSTRGASSFVARPAAWRPPVARGKGKKGGGWTAPVGGAPRPRRVRTTSPSMLPDGFSRWSTPHGNEAVGMRWNECHPHWTKELRNCGCLAR